MLKVWGMCPSQCARFESSRWHASYSDERLVEHRLSSHRRKLERLGALALPRTARVLDVACGTGEALTLLHREGFVDLSGSDITIDASLGAEPWVRVDEADACALPHADASFDAVLSMHALHHLGGPIRVAKGLEEWLRVLRPGGRLMLLDHYDSPQLRAAFWGLRQRWATWPTSGLRAFRRQLEEERSYLYDYLDAWHSIPVTLRSLACDVLIDRRGLFFFYWAGTKRG